MSPLQVARRKINPKKLTKVADVFSGLAHPVRLSLVELLENGKPRTVGEILEAIPIEPTVLTHHLTKMKTLGILKSNKKGRNIYYRLVMMEITGVFDCIQNCKM